ncbi:hypothetical protein DYB26_008996 [Aphanomyces astaci]|uniref:NADAR domain-containing protein n=1 Tax=Aphanomyces astaci TaxID=112090 RepID=A0A397E8B0_APHAT|nr:hypothetical protein DYB36_010995 [Aphanomyces astaci]RHY66316.1 hypothetical protein DYB34_011116 [Aphanomyces astaci]RHY77438.1 hypothetical protein DYB38_007341 [Aphanomyces astaci]RHY98806.1 hypothetical protein DYB26_008996 [Aphanomyces astaci]RHZ16410.1 hypothetical protein DYB31_002967 [Aphanomyces astaci]
MAELTRSALCASIEQGTSYSYHVFVGQDPAASSGLDGTFLSQAFPAPFQVNQVKYATAEHYMMARKAALFGDVEIRDRILETFDPDQAKALGRQAKNFDQELWVTHRDSIVQSGNLAKFSDPANLHLKQLLLATGDLVLVDATETDKLWGIGLPPTHKHATTPGEWPGLNLLGFALMAVRCQLMT